MDIFSKIKNTLLKTISKITLKNIFKNKRAIFCILLFFVLGGIILPQLIMAAPMPASNSWLFKLSGGAIDWPSREELKASYKDAAQKLGPPANPFLNAIISAVGFILIVPTAFLAGLAADLLLIIIKPDFMGFSFTGFDNPVVAAGWPAMRDLANMIVVLGFVVIALATILRFHDYEAKKLLPKLIVVALLINFSLVICGVFIDASNILTEYFLKNGGFTQKSMGSIITEQTKYITENFDSVSDPTGVLGNVAGTAFVNIMMFVVFMLFVFLFLVRYIALWFLVILSPLAFVFYVFPSTKKFFSMWWSNFFQWCIIGATGSFFLYLADKLSSNMFAGKTPNSIMAALVPGIVLVVGFLFALKTSAMGSSIITSRAGNYFNKGKSALGGAAIGAGKNLAAISGAQRLGLGAKDMATRFGERFGLTPIGTTAANRRARLTSSDRNRRSAEMSDEEKAKRILQNHSGKEAALDRANWTRDLAKNGTLGLLGRKADKFTNEAMRNGVRYEEVVGGLSAQRLMRDMRSNAGGTSGAAARVKELKERGELYRMMAPGVSNATRQAAVNAYVNSGGKINDLAKSDYRFKGFDTGNNGRAAAVGSLNSDRTVNRNAIGADAARQEQLSANWSGMSGVQRRSIDAADITEGFLASKSVNAESISDFGSLAYTAGATTTDNDRLARFGTVQTGGTQATIADLRPQVRDALRDAAIAAGADATAPDPLTAAPPPGANTRELDRLKGIRAEMLRVLTKP